MTSLIEGHAKGPP